jgi:hypothetical protein
MKTKIEIVSRVFLWAAAGLLLLGVGAARGQNLTKWSEYPNTNHIADNWLSVWAQPGATNWSSTYFQIAQQLSTDSRVLSAVTNIADGEINRLVGSGTNTGSAYGQFFLTTQTNLLFDFALTKNYEVFSTYTLTNVVTFAVTNIVMPSNRVQSLTILLRNLSTSNLVYSFPPGISWVWQADTNAPVPTNIWPGQIQQIQLFCTPAFGTNSGLIGSVNP